MALKVPKYKRLYTTQCVAAFAQLAFSSGVQSFCRGDAELRSNYSFKLRHLMQQAGVSSDIRHIIDLGCSTGLSSLELHKTFPSAHITAVDLSPHFIAVAKVTQQQRQVSIVQNILSLTKLWVLMTHCYMAVCLQTVNGAA